MTVGRSVSGSTPPPRLIRGGPDYRTTWGRLSQAKYKGNLSSGLCSRACESLARGPQREGGLRIQVVVGRVGGPDRSTIRRTCTSRLRKERVCLSLYRRQGYSGFIVARPSGGPIRLCRECAHHVLPHVVVLHAQGREEGFGPEWPAPPLTLTLYPRDVGLTTHRCR